MGPQSRDRAKTSPAITCIKILLHIFNFIYLIIGICVLAIGVSVQVKLKDYIQLTDFYYTNTAYIMIGVGVLVMLVAVGGFFCTAKDKIALLYMYGIFIVVLAIMQVAAGIAGGVMVNKVKSDIKSSLLTSMRKKDNAESWNDVQQTLKCCGVDGYQDWLNEVPSSCYEGNFGPANPGGITNTSPSTTKAPTTNATTTNATTATTTTTVPTTTTTVPTTTSATKQTTAAPVVTTTTAGKPTPTQEIKTPTNDSAVAEETTTVKSSAAAVTTVSTVPPSMSAAGSRRKRRSADKPYDKGCYKLIRDEISQYLGVIVGVSIGFVILQIIGAILACCLARRTSRNNYEQIY